MQASRAAVAVTALAATGFLLAGCGLEAAELPEPEGRRTTTSRTSTPVPPPPAEVASPDGEPGVEPYVPPEAPVEDAGYGYDPAWEAPQPMYEAPVEQPLTDELPEVY